MKSRKFYKDLFADYPDLVTIDDFRAMLGGMGYVQACKLMKDKTVHHFFIHRTYMIPKESVIDYIRSPHYAEYRLKLKATIPY